MRNGPYSENEMRIHLARGRALHGAALRGGLRRAFVETPPGLARLVVSSLGLRMLGHGRIAGLTA